jgi:hypothetical protein
MLDAESIREIRGRFRDTAELAADNRVLCKATYTQDNPSGEPHAGGDLLFIYVNEVEVGRITFTFEEGEPKSKTIEVDVTAQLTEPFNFIKVRTLVDKDFVQAGCSSEAEFSVRVKGKRKVKEEFGTKLPLRTVETAWLIA